MVRLGHIGNGGAVVNSSSSTSNLSALAPPFTVDRLNPKPNSNPNPLLNYSDSSYSVEPFNPTWQYAPPSAPRPELVIDSDITSVPISDDYGFSAAACVSPTSSQWSGAKATGCGFGYGGEVKPYYSSYVPPLVGEDSVSVKDEGSRYNVVPTSGFSAAASVSPTSSQWSGTKVADSGFGYGGEVKPYYSSYVPPFVGEDSVSVKDEGSCYNVVPTSGLSVTSQSWMEFDYDRQWREDSKKSGLDGNFSSGKANVDGSYGYKNQLYQGGKGSEIGNKYKEDSGFSYQNFNKVSGRQVHTGSSSTRHMEDNTCIEQTLDFFPYDLVSASRSPYPESYPSAVTCETQKNVANYQKLCGPFEKSGRSVDTPFPGPVSVIRPSPTVVIRPPPSNGTLGQNFASRVSAFSENVGGGQSVDLDYAKPSKLIDSGRKPSSKIKEDSFGTNIFNFSKQVNDPISSSSVKELSSSLQSRDISNCKVKRRYGPTLPDINVSSGFVIGGDNVQVVNSTEDSSEIIDHHNTAVDSPCWKGAPSSPFLPCDIEAGNSNYGKVNFDEHHGYCREEFQNPDVVVDSNGFLCEKIESNLGNEHECSRNNVAVASICSTKEQSLLDGSNVMRKETNLQNNFSVFEMEVSDTKHLIGDEGAVNDVCEVGAVAVHAAEKVLASPASQEDATEHTIVTDPKLNVPAMVKAIHNLSELLCFHLSSDACSLEEENTETLKHVISNLHTCLSRKVSQATNKPDQNNPMGNTSNLLGVPHNVGTNSGGSHTKSEAANSNIMFDRLDMFEDERNYKFSCKKDKKSLIFSPLRDDLDVTGDDGMTKDIKKILEDNFELNEELNSQALLFKSLWLEAEAKLCSVTYKARFDRMKIQMEEIKLKAPQENEDTPEMMSQVCVSPDPVTASELAHKARDDMFAIPTLQNTSIPGTSGPADDIEASIVARFNILKSREDNPKPINMKEEQQSEMADNEHGGSIMDRFNILKSREEHSKSIFTDVVEKEPEMIGGQFAGEQYLQPCNKVQSENETLDLGRFGSCVDGAGYEPLNEYHLSVTNDPMIHSFKSSEMISESNPGLHNNSSSSDWEHVLKDDFSWKNCEC